MKNKILEILEHHPDTYISGERIGNFLHMTRANVWKEIQKLKKDGMSIASVRNLGYKLVHYENNYSQTLITNGVTHLKSVELLDSIDSTNAYARSSHHKSNHLVIANEQTKGKGRMGRQFFSPDKHGIYMSLNLQPSLSLDEVQLITICAALAVSGALESLYGLEPKIKWLNDVFLDDKKVCGILTEGDIELELKRFQSLTLGIGINTHPVDTIPTELQSIYTALDNTVNRNQLVIAVLNNFYDLYLKLPNNQVDLIEAYKKRSNVLGKDIRIKSDNDEVYRASDITLEGHLVVHDRFGHQRILNSGEISVEAVHHDN